MSGTEKCERSLLLPLGAAAGGKYTHTHTLAPPSTGSGEAGLLCSGQHGRAQSGLGLTLAIVFLVAQVSGLGILALPWAIAQTGWIGIGVVMAAGVVVALSACYLATAWVIMEERWPEYQRACRKPYTAMAFRALGSPGWYAANIIQGATLFGTSMVTMLLSGELLGALLGPVLPSVTVCSWLLVCGAALVPLSWLASPKQFWQVSILALMATVAAVVVVVVEVVVEEPGKDADPSFPPPTLRSFLLGCGTIMFSYGGAVTFPTVQNDMADRTKFPLAIVLSFAVLLLMYVPVSVFGYAEFGAEVEPNVLLSVSGPAVVVVQVLMLVNNVFTYILIINPVSQSLEEAMHFPNTFGWRRMVLRTTLVVLGVLVSLAVQSFGRVLNLLGSFAVPILSIVLPPIFYMRLCDSHENPRWPSRTISLPHRLLLCLLIVTGSVLCAGATYTAMQFLLEPSDHPTASCFSFP